MKEIALITGGAKRLGREMGLFLAKAGFDIALHFNASSEAADKTKNEIETLGCQCLIIQGDLGHPPFYKTLIEQVYDEWGGLTLLINNASLFKKIAFKNTSMRDFNQNIDVHLKAPFFLSQAFSEKCEQGAIINILDTRVERYQTGHFVYTLTKKALKELTLLLAKELAPQIRVNGICPGPILAPEDQGMNYLKKVGEQTPMKQAGNVSDILNAVHYLCQSDYVTGEILYVDGGERLI